MLHLVFQLTSHDSSILQRIENGDDVIFFENAVFKINKGSFLNTELQQMIDKNIRLFVLQSEIETRGFSLEQLCTGIQAISYSEFVALTEKNKVIQKWN